MTAECWGHGVPMRLDGDGLDAMLVCPECCDDCPHHVRDAGTSLCIRCGEAPASGNGDYRAESTS